MDKAFFFDQVRDYLAVCPTGARRWSSVNQALADRLGWSAEEVISREVVDALDISRVKCASGDWAYVDWQISDHDGFQYWVGRERLSYAISHIHHRVKNHIQMLVSMLNLQASASRDTATARELAVAESRVRAVGRLYEPLYTSKDYATIEFGAYLRQLASDLLGPEAEVQAADMVISMEQALPMALIATEVLRPLDGLPCTVAMNNHGDNTLQLSVAAQSGLRTDSDSELLDLLVKQVQGVLRFEDQKLSVTFRISDE